LNFESCEKDGPLRSQTNVWHRGETHFGESADDRCYFATPSSFTDSKPLSLLNLTPLGTACPREVCRRTPSRKHYRPSGAAVPLFAVLLAAARNMGDRRVSRSSRFGGSGCMFSGDAWS
jgi:hypothetical protein